MSSLNKVNLTPELRREINHLLTDMRYVFERISTRQQAVVLHELLMTPVAEFRTKYGLGGRDATRTEGKSIQT